MGCLCSGEVWTHPLAPAVGLAPLGAIEKTIRVKGRTGQIWWGRWLRAYNHGQAHGRLRVGLRSQVPGGCQTASPLLQASQEEDSSASPRQTASGRGRARPDL